MAAPIEIDSYDLELTEAWLLAHDFAPLYAGDTVTWRFQVLDEDGLAVSLASANLVMSVRDSKGNLLFDRRSTDDVAGHSPATKQIAADADQTTEDTTTFTGKGWFEVRWKPADETDAGGGQDLDAHVGRRQVDIVIEFGDGSVRTYARGVMDILRRRTAGSQVP